MKSFLIIYWGIILTGTALIYREYHTKAVNAIVRQKLGAKGLLKSEEKKS